MRDVLVLNAVKIGSIIKSLRKERGMTGSVLAVKAGFSQSKMSKLESGKYTLLQPSDIERILNILEAPKTIQQQAFLLLEKIYPDALMRKLDGKMLISDVYSIEKDTQSIRLYNIGHIPVLLQTMDYRIGLLKQLFTIPTEQWEDILKDFVKRQDLLWSKEHHLHAIMTEAALYTLVTHKRAHIAQLDRLERLLLTPHTKIGIIPVQSGLASAEASSFTLYDDTLICKVFAEGEIHSNDKGDIVLYLKLFNELEKKAHYSEDARVCIRRAIDYFE